VRRYETLFGFIMVISILGRPNVGLMFYTGCFLFIFLFVSFSTSCTGRSPKGTQPNFYTCREVNQICKRRTKISGFYLLKLGAYFGWFDDFSTTSRLRLMANIFETTQTYDVGLHNRKRAKGIANYRNSPNINRNFHDLWFRNMLK